MSAAKTIMSIDRNFRTVAICRYVPSVNHLGFLMQHNHGFKVQPNNIL